MITLSILTLDIMTPILATNRMLKFSILTPILATFWHNSIKYNDT
jgi:hypothetical protein